MPAEGTEVQFLADENDATVAKAVCLVESVPEAEEASVQDRTQNKNEATPQFKNEPDKGSTSASGTGQ